MLIGVLSCHFAEDVQEAASHPRLYCARVELLQVSKLLDKVEDGRGAIAAVDLMIEVPLM